MAVLDDVGEGRFERSSTNQEPIDILLLDQVLGVLLSYRTTVDNTDFVGWLARSLQVFPEPAVHLLSLLWSGSQTSSDGPDWFIGQDELIPPNAVNLSLLNKFLERVKLPLDDVLGLVSLPLFDGLAETEDDVEFALEGNGNFISDKLIVLAEQVPSLGVAENGPIDSGVLEVDWTMWHHPYLISPV